MKTPHEAYRSVRMHAFKVSAALSALDYEGLGYPSEEARRKGGFEDAADWIKLASDLGSVTLDPVGELYDTSMCSTAYYADLAHSRFHAEYAARIVRLLFVWNALEILVKALSLEPHPTEKGRKRFSSAKAATWALKQRGVQADDYQGYLHLWEHVELHLQSHPWLVPEKIPDEWDAPFINEAGYGLELCRLVRNRLVHGISRLPIPEQYGGAQADGNALGFLDVAVKLLLISIQMLVASQLDGYDVVPEDDTHFHLVFGSDVLKSLRSFQIDPEIPRESVQHV
jgi:hypothetical protein